MSEKREAWRNSGRGSVYLTKFGPRGEEVSVRVPGGGIVHLTPSERQVNTLSIPPKNAHLNVFENGVMIPVQLVDTAEDYEEIASNPNLLGDSDIKQALKQSAPKLKKTLAEISNLNLVLRFQELAAEDDSLTVPKAKAIDARVAELTELPQITNELPDDFDSL